MWILSIVIFTVVAGGPLEEKQIKTEFKTEQECKTALAKYYGEADDKKINFVGRCIAPKK